MTVVLRVGRTAVTKLVSSTPKCQASMVQAVAAQKPQKWTTVVHFIFLEIFIALHIKTLNVWSIQPETQNCSNIC